MQICKRSKTYNYVIYSTKSYFDKLIPSIGFIIYYPKYSRLDFSNTVKYFSDIKLSRLMKKMT